MNMRLTTALVALALTCVAATLAWAQSADNHQVIDQPVDHDVYAAARELTVTSAVDGDLVAAGRSVTVDGNVSGDIIIAAKDIDIRSRVNDDLRLAAQNVTIRAPVTGHVVAAGENITIAERVGDWAWLAGNKVDVQGGIGGDLRIRARSVTLNATVDGNVQVIGNALRVGPAANVRGNLVWRSSNEADISPQATIDGDVISEPAPGLAQDVRSGRAVAFTISLVITVAVLFLLFKGPMRAGANRIGSHPGRSLALGFAVMVATPVLAIALLFSPLSAWVGLGLLGFYAVTLLIGVLTGLFALGDLALRRFRSKPAAWQALLAILASVIVVGALSYVPYLGALSVFALWLLGTGAVCWGGWVALRRSGRDQPKPA